MQQEEVGTAKRNAKKGEALEVKTGAKRNVATQIFVLYTDKEAGGTDLKSFDFKTDLDAWLTETGNTVQRVIRGREKKIQSTNKVLFL